MAHPASNDADATVMLMKRHMGAFIAALHLVIDMVFKVVP
ncbi:MAG: hypothetical protein NVSMB6_18770 [Burkholderiaceae bacterium]